jgi:hypothetical protein
VHRLGPDALLRRQQAVEQQLVHAQHAVHRGADLVAHGGQEVALGLARGLGGLLGELQLHRARHDLFLEMVAVCGEVGVALLDLLEHGVETGAQLVDLGHAAGLRAHAQVAHARDARHQRGELVQRLEQRGVEAPQQDAAGPQREQRRGGGGGHQPGGLAIQRGQADLQHQRAVALGSAGHRLCQHEEGRVHGERCPGGARGRFAAVGWVAGEEAALGVVDGCSQDVGRVAQRAQQLAGGLVIVERQCRRHVLCQHPGLHAAGVDERPQADGEAAGQHDQRHDRHRRGERDAVDAAQQCAQGDALSRGHRAPPRRCAPSPWAPEGAPSWPVGSERLRTGRAALIGSPRWPAAAAWS